ncbi:MAG: RDD family protein [Propionibacteriaceae bacterium]|nr:RDD family protein [Propionibacteriaceae bacterium]
MSEYTSQNVSVPAAGWYPDPADAARQRYWDGAHWTADIRGAQPTSGAPGLAAPVDPYAAQQQPAFITPTQPSYGDPAQAPANNIAPGYGAPAGFGAAGAAAGGAVPGYGAAPAQQQAPAGIPNYGAYGDAYYIPPANYANANGPATPDGVPLAGWWWRVLAVIVDGILLNILSLFYTRLLPAEWGYSATRMTDVYQDILAGKYIDLSGFVLGSLIVSVVGIAYVVAMLSIKGATVGQLACGLRVVPVGQGRYYENHSGLLIGKAVIGVCVYNVSILATVLLLFPSLQMSALYSILTLAISLFTALNYLWPLWDSKKQALHNKFAGTQVVRL